MADKQRPNQIKLFFDRERPSNPQWTRRLGRNHNEEILEEERVSPPRRGSFKNCVTVCRQQMWNNPKHKNKQAIVKRPNPEAPASIEIFKVAIGLLCVQQDSCDQETGEYKKEVHSHPSVGRYGG